MVVLTATSGKSAKPDNQKQRAENDELLALWRLLQSFFTWKNDHTAAGGGLWVYSGPPTVTAQAARELLESILDGRPPYLAE